MKFVFDILRLALCIAKPRTIDDAAFNWFTSIQ